MARSDGRVEPGQSLKSAFSARAWNRAQDAADIVLGERTVFGAEARQAAPSVLRRNASLLNGAPFRQTRFGMIVNSVYENLPANNAVLAQKPPLDPGMHRCETYRPVPFQDRRNTAASRFSVLAGGPMLPASFSGGYVELITHGTCLAMVRKNPGAFLPRVRPAVIRYSTDTEINLRGIAEDSDCGWGELLYWTNIKPFSSERQTAEGIDPVEALDDTTSNIYYAVVRL